MLLLLLGCIQSVFVPQTPDSLNIDALSIDINSSPSISQLIDTNDTGSTIVNSIGCFDSNYQHIQEAIDDKVSDINICWGVYHEPIILNDTDFTITADEGAVLFNTQMRVQNSKLKLVNLEFHNSNLQFNNSEVIIIASLFTEMKNALIFDDSQLISIGSRYEHTNCHGTTSIQFNNSNAIIEKGRVTYNFSKNYYGAIGMGPNSKVYFYDVYWNRGDNWAPDWNVGWDIFFTNTQQWGYKFPRPRRYIMCTSINKQFCVQKE